MQFKTFRLHPTFQDKAGFDTICGVRSINFLVQVIRTQESDSYSLNPLLLDPHNNVGTARIMSHSASFTFTSSHSLKKI